MFIKVRKSSVKFVKNAPTTMGAYIFLVPKTAKLAAIRGTHTSLLASCSFLGTSPLGGMQRMSMQCQNTRAPTVFNGHDKQ